MIKVFLESVYGWPLYGYVTGEAAKFAREVQARGGQVAVHGWPDDPEEEYEEDPLHPNEYWEPREGTVYRTKLLWRDDSAKPWRIWGKVDLHRAANEDLMPISLDEENQQERWWHSFQGAYHRLRRSEPELWSVCHIFHRHAERVLVSPRLGERFQRFAESLPGWTDGPTFAPNPLLIGNELGYALLKGGEA
jgi:hypothetical protein